MIFWDPAHVIHFISRDSAAIRAALQFKATAGIWAQPSAWDALWRLIHGKTPSYVTIVLTNQLLNDCSRIKKVNRIPDIRSVYISNPDSTKYKTATHTHTHTCNRAAVIIFTLFFNSSITLPPSTIDNLRILWLQYVSLATFPLGDKRI